MRVLGKVCFGCILVPYFVLRFGEMEYKRVNSSSSSSSSSSSFFRTALHQHGEVSYNIFRTVFIAAKAKRTADTIDVVIDSAKKTVRCFLPKKSRVRFVIDSITRLLWNN